MMKGIANPQLKSGGLQIRRNEGTAKRLACPVSREDKKSKKILLEMEYFVFLRKN